MISNSSSDPAPVVVASELFNAPPPVRRATLTPPPRERLILPSTITMTTDARTPDESSSSPPGSPRPYVYSPMHAGQFRLLLLHPHRGNPDAPLVGELVVEVLDVPPGTPTAEEGEESDSVQGEECSVKGLSRPRRHAYEALSYVWGSSETPQVMYLSCAPYQEEGGSATVGIISLTASLAGSLRRVRLADRVRVLWADGVCINQASLAEKEQQVPLMSHVFGRAERVLCDLGEEADGSDRALQMLGRYWRENIKDGLGALGGHKDSAEDVASFLGIELPEKGKDGSGKGEATVDTESREEDNDTASTASTLVPDVDDVRWEPVKRFFRRPWFRRLWIVQEFVLAREPVLHCGSDIVPWRELLAGCLGYIDGQPYLGSDFAERDWYGFLSYMLMGVIRIVREADIAHDIASRDGDASNTAARRAFFRQMAEDLLGKSASRRMVDLLDSFRMSQTSLDRDHYFALIGLAEDADLLNIVPDYSSPIEDVVAAMGRALIVCPGGESMLMRAGLWRAEMEAISARTVGDAAEKAMQPAPMTSPKEFTWCPGSPTTPARLDSYTARLPSRRTTSIPTWTQDFSKLDAGLLHMVENPRNRAASSYSFVCSLSRGLGNILTVLGRRIDVVAAVAPHFPFGDFTRRPYEHVAHSIKTLLTPDLAVDVGSGIGGAKYGPTGEHLHTAAWKALFQHVSSGEGTEAAAQRKAEMGFAAIQWITMGFRTDVEAFVEDWKVREAAEGKGAHAELADKPVVVVGAEASKDKKSDNDGNYEDNGDEHEDGNTCRNEGFFDVRRAMHIIAPLVPSHLPSPSPSSDLTIPPAVTDKQSPLLPTITDLLEHTADGVLGWIMADSMRVIRTRGGPKSNGGGRSGWFGSAMPGVRPGDEVWLIRGCSLPLVLRPPDSDEDKAELEDGEEAEDELRNEYQ